MAVPRNLEDADLRMSRLDDEKRDHVLHYLAEVVLAMLPNETERAIVRRGLNQRGLHVRLGRSPMPE